MSELKPCPLCGGEAALVAEPGDTDGTGPLAFVYCQKCGAGTEREEYDVDAIAAWNIRTPPAADAEPVAAGLHDTLMIELAYCRHVELTVSETAIRVEALIQAYGDARAREALERIATLEAPVKQVGEQP